MFQPRVSVKITTISDALRKRTGRKERQMQEEKFFSLFAVHSGALLVPKEAVIVHCQLQAYGQTLARAKYDAQRLLEGQPANQPVEQAKIDAATEHVRTARHFHVAAQNAVHYFEWYQALP